jgi:hypothetical protein
MRGSDLNKNEHKVTFFGLHKAEHIISSLISFQGNQPKAINNLFFERVDAAHIEGTFSIITCTESLQLKSKSSATPGTS